MKPPDYQIGDKFYYYDRFRKNISFGEITKWDTTRGWCCQEARGHGSTRGKGVPQIRYLMKSETALDWIEEKYLSKNKENLEKFLINNHSNISKRIINPDGKVIRDYRKLGKRLPE